MRKKGPLSRALLFLTLPAPAGGISFPVFRKQQSVTWHIRITLTPTWGLLLLSILNPFWGRHHNFFPPRRPPRASSFIQPCLSGLRTTFQSSEEGAARHGNGECYSGRAGPTHRACAPAGAALCRLEAQNMLEHGKKGICLSDSDMFQHSPTGSCISQNNCDSGSCSLAYDYICIMLQNSGQSGHTRTGAAGMHGPQWSSKLHRDSTHKKCGLTRSIQTTRRGPGQCPPSMGWGGGEAHKEETTCPHSAQPRTPKLSSTISDAYFGINVSQAWKT